MTIHSITYKTYNEDNQIKHAILVDYYQNGLLKSFSFCKNRPDDVKESLEEIQHFCTKAIEEINNLTMPEENQNFSVLEIIPCYSDGKENPYVFKIGDTFGNLTISRSFLKVKKIILNEIFLEETATKNIISMSIGEFKLSFGINGCTTKQYLTK